MIGPIVLRVHLDTSKPDHSRGCVECPLGHYSVQHDLSFCVAGPLDDEGGRRVTPSYGPAPEWCPLRIGPVTVEGVP